MITLGIDHALSGPCGLAIIDNGPRPGVLHIQIVTYSGSFDDRCFRLHQIARALLRPHGVECIACEETYVAPNKPRAALALEHAAGLLHALAIVHGLPFVRIDHATTDKTKQTLPAPWCALPQIAQGQRVHAMDAIAVAWAGAGMVERTRRLAEVRG